MALGDGGAGNGALGRAAVRRRWARAAALLPLLLLAGCKSAAELTGFAAGGVAGVATANPAVGYIVGIATAAAADQVFKVFGRTRQHAEQQAIADAAAGLPEGDAAQWHIHHFIPIGNEHGEVRVTHVIATPLADCRQIVFSVAAEAPRPPRWYATSICRDGADGWQWALAEPAVPRWGFLQQ